MSTPRQHIVVMKFGGTSVEDSASIQRTAAIVADRLRKRLNPIVVVSAMSKMCIRDSRRTAPRSPQTRRYLQPRAAAARLNQRQ